MGGGRGSARGFRARARARHFSGWFSHGIWGAPPRRLPPARPLSPALVGQLAPPPPRPRRGRGRASRRRAQPRPSDCVSLLSKTRNCLSPHAHEPVRARGGRGGRVRVQIRRGCVQAFGSARCGLLQPTDGARQWLRLSGSPPTPHPPQVSPTLTFGLKSPMTPLARTAGNGGVLGELAQGRVPSLRNVFFWGLTSFPPRSRPLQPSP